MGNIPRLSQEIAMHRDFKNMKDLARRKDSGRKVFQSRELVIRRPTAKVKYGALMELRRVSIAGHRPNLQYY